MKTQNWLPQDTENSQYIGMVEFPDLINSEDKTNPDLVYFEIVKTATHYVFGSYCNIGFMESGNYLIDPDFSDSENLQELLSDLESYYWDGDGFQTDRFAHNARM